MTFASESFSASVPLSSAEPGPTVAVVTAGHGPASSTARLGIALGDATARAMGAGTRVRHLELRTFAGDVTEAVVTGVAGPSVADAIAVLQGADALVVVTPTINASFSGLLKSFLDTLPLDTLRGLPTAIAATGGTQRHTLVLDQSVRPMLAFLRAVVLPTCLYATADEWDGPHPGDELASRIGQVGDELAVFTGLALTRARSA
ncbi:NAD(P)H-dependent oxidoreductase [Mariniluteicoccus flavus]